MLPSVLYWPDVAASRFLLVKNLPGLADLGPYEVAAVAHRAPGLSGPSVRETALASRHRSTIGKPAQIVTDHAAFVAAISQGRVIAAPPEKPQRRRMNEGAEQA